MTVGFGTDVAEDEELEVAVTGSVGSNAGGSVGVLAERGAVAGSPTGSRARSCEDTTIHVTPAVSSTSAIMK